MHLPSTLNFPRWYGTPPLVTKIGCSSASAMEILSLNKSTQLTEIEMEGLSVSKQLRVKPDGVPILVYSLSILCKEKASHLDALSPPLTSLMPV